MHIAIRTAVLYTVDNLSIGLRFDNVSGETRNTGRWHMSFTMVYTDITSKSLERVIFYPSIVVVLSKSHKRVIFSHFFT